ncbi:unnamed protein product [Orchesella dallaii]|uniref:BTB domain-containing protein n=1 Tax=Orchesella dallaii TaxID=48710 RepID=A0ABP1S632_9HEXA
MSRIINPSNPDILDDDNDTEFYPIIPPSTRELMDFDEWILGKLPSALTYNFHCCIQNTGGSSEDGNIPDTEIRWKSIFPIDSLRGVNSEEKLFEYKVGDYMLQYRQDPSYLRRWERVHSSYYDKPSSKTRACFLGSTLFVYINMRENKKEAVFVSSFCHCQVCNEAWPWKGNPFQGQGTHWVEFDAFSLKPVVMTLGLEGGEEECTKKLKFLPGVTNQFDMMKEKDDRNFFTVAYYCSVPLDALPSVPFKEFNNRGGLARKVPSVPTGDLQVKSSICIKILKTSKIHTPKTVESQESELQSTFKALFDEKELTDVVLVSKDGKLFACNAEILSVRSPVFEKIFADKHFLKGQERRIQLEEGASAVETLIKFIYFQETGIEKLSVSGLVGTLKLAYLHGFKEFVAVTFKILLEKMKALEWEDVEGLWELYRFATKEDSVQIIARLKRPAIIELRRLILAKKNKRARQDKEDATNATACMNWAFGNNEALAKELAVDLERLLRWFVSH